MSSPIVIASGTGSSIVRSNPGAHHAGAAQRGEGGDEAVDVEGVGGAHPVAAAEAHQFRLRQVEAVHRQNRGRGAEAGLLGGGVGALAGSGTSGDAEERAGHGVSARMSATPLARRS
jgi:hypothetical protein